MDTDFVIKQHSLESPFEAVLYDDDERVDLTHADAIYLVLWGPQDEYKRYLLTKDTQTGIGLGRVFRVWAAGDTGIAGWWRADVHVTWPGSRVQTFPQDDYFDFRVLPVID
jgi:hypothetical protein